MTNETQQPLREQPPRSTDDSKLVAEILGGEAAADMDELVGDQAEEPAVVANEIELSTKEQAATSEAEKTMAEKRCDEYIVWATGINMDRDWVDETFTFLPDGSVIAEGDIYIANHQVECFPPNLCEVGGNLDASNNRISSLEGLPSIIGGYLDLSDNQITSLRGLPETIHGDLVLKKNKITSLDGMSHTVHKTLDLSENPITSLEGLPKTVGWNVILINIPATSIPEKLDIKQKVVVKSSQEELITDCLAKGYEYLISLFL